MYAYVYLYIINIYIYMYRCSVLWFDQVRLNFVCQIRVLKPKGRYNLTVYGIP